MKLGRTILDIRKERKMTQEEFAKFFMLHDRQYQIGRKKRIIRI